MNSKLKNFEFFLFFIKLYDTIIAHFSKRLFYGFLEKRKKKFDDFSDGHWVKAVPGLNVVMTCFHPKRTNSEVFFKHEIDITNLLSYLEKKNQNSEYKITLFHALLTIFARVCNERRLLNRFIQGARICERDKIIIRFLAKKRLH